MCYIFVVIDVGCVVVWVNLGNIKEFDGWVGEVVKVVGVVGILI